MKKLVAFSTLATLALLLCFLHAPTPASNPSPLSLMAQQPSDQSVTRPDHYVTAGDLGACNEGDTEYSALTHTGKRCIALNTWGMIPAVASPLNNGVFALSSTGTPVTVLAGDANLVSNTTTGLSAQRVCHVTYNFAVDGGATPIVPAANCVLPAKAVITNVGVQSTTAVTAAGSATVAIGCVGGTACGASALMAATAKASLGTAAFGQSIPVPQTSSTWVETSASGGITLTIAVGPLTAGLIEIYVFYYVSSS